MDSLQGGSLITLYSCSLQHTLTLFTSSIRKELSLAQGSFRHDDDDDVFIELPGLPNRGMLCGYKNGSSAAVASLSGIIYLMYNWLCSEVTSGSFAPVSPKFKKGICYSSAVFWQKSLVPNSWLG